MNTKKIIALLSVLCLIFNMAACKQTVQTEPPSDTMETQQQTNEAPEEQADASNDVTMSEIDEAAKKVLDDKVPVEISFWTGLGTANYTLMENIVAAFQTKYPNIKVELSNQGPTGELTAKLTQNIVAQTTPTISHVAPATFYEYVKNGAIIDLAPYYNNTKIGYSDAQKSSFYPYYMDQVESYGPEGTMFGFPSIMKSTDVLIYNKTLFDQHGWSAPKTWDEAAEYSKIIYEETGTAGLSFDGGAYPETAFKTLSQQWGSPYIIGEGNVDIDNDASRAALEFYKTNLDKGYFTLAALMPSASGGYGSKGFLMEECYMAVNPAAGVSYCIPKEEAGNKIFELGVASLPQKDLANQYAAFRGVDLCVFSNSTNEQRVAAWLFIQFMSDDTNNIEWFINSAFQPITSTLMDVPEYKAFLEHPADGSAEYYKAAAVNTVLAMGDALKPDVIVSNADAIATECGVLWDSIMIGGADINAALAETEAKIS